MADAAMGPKQPCPRVLTPEQEALIVVFRRHNLLPRGDGLYALQPVGRAASDPARDAFQPASRPAAPCRLRWTFPCGIGPWPDGHSRLPEIDGDKPAKKRFKAYPIGYFHIEHINCAEARTDEGELRLFVAISRPRLIRPPSGGRQAPAEATARAGSPWLVSWRARARWKRPSSCASWSRPCMRPWIKRMNRTLMALSPRDGAVKRYRYSTYDKLRAHLQLFLDAYNHGRRLKALRGLAPCDLVCRAWTKEPERFKLDPPPHPPRDRTPRA